MIRTVGRIALVALAIAFAAACGGAPAEPTATPASPPPSPPPGAPTGASGPESPMASGAPPAAFDKSKEEMGGNGVASSFEKALNAGDDATAQSLCTTTCWSKECGSITKQAKTKFKVKLTGTAETRGTRSVATMDALCDGGTRPCDRVEVLVEKDCTTGKWLVADVTEDKDARAKWLRGARASCPGGAVAR